MENISIYIVCFWLNVSDSNKEKMILARLKWNTPLYKVDQFITKFRKKYKNKRLRINIKLTDTECLIYMFRKIN